MTATAAKTKTYDESSIGMLEGLEAVRKRPSMYIGDTDKKGLHHLVWEIVDNSVDEYLNGYADAITVTLHKNGDAVTVADNGRGIPVDMHPKYKKSGAGTDPDHAALRRQSSAKATATSTPAVCTASARRWSTPCRASSSPPSAATASNGSRPSNAASRPASIEKIGPIPRPRHHHLLRAGPRHLQAHPVRRRLDQVAPGGHVVHPQRPEDHLQERGHQGERST